MADKNTKSVLKECTVSSMKDAEKFVKEYPISSVLFLETMGFTDKQISKVVGIPIKEIIRMRPIEEIETYKFAECLFE